MRDEACVQRVQRLREVRLSGVHEKYTYVKENTLQDDLIRYTICV